MSESKEQVPVKNTGKKNNFKTVAVTGANGFIASHLVERLLREGFNVRAIVRDKDDQEKTQHLTKIAEETKSTDRLSFYNGDLLKPGSYDEAFKGAECVFHTAAVVQLHHKDPMKGIVQPSVDGTKNVLDSCDKAGTVKRLVYTSSIAAVMNFDTPEDSVWNEDSWNTWGNINNGDAYGFAKMTAEKMVHEHCGKASTSYDSAAINPGVVVGPCFTKAHTKTSPVFIRQVLYHNEQPDIFVNFVDVRDVVEAHVQAMLRNEGVPGQRFLLVGPAGECVFWLRELGERCTTARPQYDMASPITPWWKMLLARLTWQMSSYDVAMTTRQLRFDNTRSKEVLGVKYTSMEKTLGDTIDSMLPFVKVKEAKK